MPKTKDHDESEITFEFLSLSPMNMSHEQHDKYYDVDHHLLHLNPAQAEYRDFDGSIEKPRTSLLTKEQVDILEAQFRAHPKPDSMTKRQLAMQTNLTLPRVAVSRLCR